MHTPNPGRRSRRPNTVPVDLDPTIAVGLTVTPCAELDALKRAVSGPFSLRLPTHLRTVWFGDTQRSGAISDTGHVFG